VEELDGWLAYIFIFAFFFFLSFGRGVCARAISVHREPAKDFARSKVMYFHFAVLALGK
jgi:hypothetical protein